MGLGPLLADRPRQDRTFDEIDQLQGSLRTLQFRNKQDFEIFQSANGDISWFALRSATCFQISSLTD